MNNNLLERRNFIKLSALGAVGSLLSTNAQAETTNIKEKDKQIIYRTLGKTGLKVPVVSMGVMRADNPNLVRAALRAGMTHLDTAHRYQEGKNEEMVGNVIKEFNREKIVLATKILMPRNKEHRMVEDAKTEDFLKMLDTSLKRLQVDYVDILYLHAIQHKDDVLRPEMLEALQKAKKDGKTRFIGVSTHWNEPEVINAAIDSGIYEVVLTSYNFKQEHIAEMDKVIKKAADAGLGIVGMKTMAGGFLDKERTKPVNATAALRWALQNENIHTTIPGFISYDELKENEKIMRKLRMSRKDKRLIETYQTTGGLFCPGCNDCIDQCKLKLPIPNLMRAYMYTYGYRDAKLGKELLATLEIPENACTDCKVCSVQCKKGFHVSERIKDIIRLQDVPSGFLS